MILVKLSLSSPHNTLNGERRQAQSFGLRLSYSLQNGIGMHFDASRPLTVARLQVRKTLGRKIQRTGCPCVFAVQAQEVVVSTSLHVRKCWDRVESGGNEVGDISIFEKTVKLVSRYAQCIPAEEPGSEDKLHGWIEHDGSDSLLPDEVLLNSTIRSDHFLYVFGYPGNLEGRPSQTNRPARVTSQEEIGGKLVGIGLPIRVCLDGQVGCNLVVQKLFKSFVLSLTEDMPKVVVLQCLRSGEFEFEDVSLTWVHVYGMNFDVRLDSIMQNVVARARDA